jgi:hypothetical protein
MSFLVNHDGTVSQKGLGPDKIAERMSAFNPDKTWRKVSDTEPLNEFSIGPPRGVRVSIVRADRTPLVPIATASVGVLMQSWAVSIQTVTMTSLSMAALSSPKQSQVSFADQLRADKSAAIAYRRTML